MTFVNQDFRIYRGDTHKLHVDLTNADGTPYDPTILGISMEWIAAPSAATMDSDALIRKTSADGGGITVASDGVDIVLTSADTDLKPGCLSHELRIVDTVSGDVSVVMTGALVVKPAMRMSAP
jgi:hypothetical protein